jgi:cyclophilin family peptidyl-prolyl cis-trans isomerase
VSKAALAGILGALLLVLAACGTESDGQASESLAKAAGCNPVTAPKPKEPPTAKPPAEPLDTSVTYSLVFATNGGVFTVELDQTLAPNTAASLVQLAETGFYDLTIFHRIVPGFVIQGGDPSQTTRGGPGYSTVDPPPADARYVKGVMAMAKTETAPSGTAGSQFFVVTAEDSRLTPEYAVVGKVTKGLDVVERIGTLGDPATEEPTAPVVITRVRVTRR